MFPKNCKIKSSEIVYQRPETGEVNIFSVSYRHLILEKITRGSKYFYSIESGDFVIIDKFIYKVRDDGGLSHWLSIEEVKKSVLIGTKYGNRLLSSGQVS
jgi:hypothetical protein